MNLQKLFEIQAELDAHIEEEHPRQEGEDRLAKKILALQVELGELAQNWRGFKFWSNDREPRTESYSMDYLVLPDGTEVEKVRNPLLEEYVDCLHFILSIGLEKGFNKKEYDYLHELNFSVYTESDTLTQFNNTFYAINDFVLEDDLESYEELFLYLIGLGRHMNFTWEQIEQAYLEKNKINHERQQNGY